MNNWGKCGLSLICTGIDTDRELHTIRLNGAYVASICFSFRVDRFGVKKVGVWSDMVQRPELTPTQQIAISAYIKRQVAVFHTRMFECVINHEVLLSQIGSKREKVI